MLKYFRTSLVAAACWMDIGTAHANQLVEGRAKIALINGTPAICLPKDAPRSFAVSSVLLMESQSFPPGMWSIRLKEGARPIRLGPGQCFPYGSVPEGYQLEPRGVNSRPLRLETDNGYYFRISRAGRLWSISQIGYYSADFCIKEAASGSVKVRNISLCADAGR
ncbi:hypothetical protein ACK1O1_11105 [Stenotrophomonas maltophilia]|uniref:hypothetical protein n=1 Tax=Stenotrophomonas maltophilia TaxID=40324 RepID=UPI00391746B2